MRQEPGTPPTRPARTHGGRPSRPRQLGFESLEDRLALTVAVELWSDLNTSTRSSNPGGFMEVQGDAYFWASQTIAETDLWKYDVSEDQFQRVDVIPLTAQELTVLGNRFVYWLPHPTQDGFQLWSSDGTADGTQLLLPDVILSQPSSLTMPQGDASQGNAWFSGFHDVATRIWRTDGTPEGTHEEAELGFMGVGSLLPWNDKLVFSGGNFDTGDELWLLENGQPQLLRDLVPGEESSFPEDLLRIGDHFFFTATTLETGREPFVSDGTPQGTTLLKDIYPGDFGSSIDNVIVAGDQIFFTAIDDQHDRELWVTDGTTDGTRLVSNLTPSGSTTFTRLAPFGSSLIFQTVGGQQQDFSIWISDGTEPIRLGEQDGVLYGQFYTGLGLAWFSHFDREVGYELWKTDGTPTGTSLVIDIEPGIEPSYPHGLTQIGQHMYFSAEEHGTGRELYRTDGTATGTRLVADFNDSQTSSSSPRFLTQVGQQTFFVAYDGTGDWLWTVDGPDAEPIKLQDFGVEPVNWMTAASDRLYFTSNDGVHGEELWTSDGTVEGTHMVVDLFPQASSDFYGLFPFEGELLFFQSDQNERLELWRTDGTEVGTTLIADLYELGIKNFGASIEGVVLDQRLVFEATGDVGSELWVSDGTLAGTHLLVDLAPGTAHGVYGGLTRVHDQLYFRGNDGVHGIELWKSDGTADGTQLVRDIWPGDESASSIPTAFQAVGEQFMFIACTADEGCEPWISDGTEAGTMLVQDTIEGPDNWTWFEQSASNGDLAWFTRRDPFGRPSLWTSDGTSDGTFRVGQFVATPGPFGFREYIDWLTPIEDRVYFAADDGIHGRELWTSDGTEQGTVMIADLAPGRDSSSPEQLARVGNTLAFSAVTRDVGFELRKLVPVEYAWHNAANPLDVDNDGEIFPIDALLIINWINRNPGNSTVPSAPATPPPFYDASPDNLITALDVLRVVNQLNRGGGGEGESAWSRFPLDEATDLAARTRLPWLLDLRWVADDQDSDDRDASG